MKSQAIKDTWIRFFKERGHIIEPSASLVPVNDPSLLWINAGVAPLKGYFEGSKVPPHPRLVNAQKCIRTNDIEQVGKTARHHTFFEMLGNFSIGDYFREDVIPWAFELLTSPDYFGIDLNLLYFTVYPTDTETYDAWIKCGVDPSRLLKTDYNYWEIGPGPCGPCSEIFYDRGDAFGKNDPSMIEEDIENDRFVEIWNIVFSQYQAKPGLSREAYPELPSKNIDTGMGFERMAAVLQGAKTNFETDLFLPIIQAIEEKTNVPYHGQMAYKVIVDHLRSVVFALADGAQLSNEGRGYVLRRLLRRAVKYGKNLGFEKPFLYHHVDDVIDVMKESYPYLTEQKTRLKHVILKEEERFFETLNAGEKRLSQWMEEHPDPVIPGDEVFKMYDTFGFPLELTEEIAESDGRTVDKEGFKAHLLAQKERARNARSQMASMRDQDPELMAFKTPSTFDYDRLELKSPIIFKNADGIVTQTTPFYAESGGQLSDTGHITLGLDIYPVIDVVKLPNGQTMHLLEEFPGNVGDEVLLKVDADHRRLTVNHHSVTHLVFKALREKIGAHVHQAGSAVGPETMRFDFTHDEIPSDETLLAIESLTQDYIHQAHPVKTILTTVEEAKRRGAIAEFGEKYTGQVRMVDMGVTLDLCGGTHVKNTAEITTYALVSVESKGSGIYRITGLAGDKVKHLDEHLKGMLTSIDLLLQKAIPLTEKADQLKIKYQMPKAPAVTFSYQRVLDLRRYMAALQEAIKTLEKNLDHAQKDQALASLDDFLKDRQGDTLVFQAALDANSFKMLVDRLFEHVKGVVIGVNVSDKLMFVVKSSNPDYHAGELVKKAASMAGGGGGGGPTFAQAGAKDVSKLQEIMDYFNAVVS
jgi:alanyl-tRNA synthetase